LRCKSLRLSGRLAVQLPAFLVVLQLSGCYYVQAARGQLEVLSGREPVDELIASDATPQALAERLALLRDARRFAVDELALPDNDSYRSYTDLERDYVVWNVFAAPEFSLDAKTWCYPIVGCVSYRGYFKEERAQRTADRLAAKGYDVTVGGVAAYSTLGRFDDPILSTMLRWDDIRIVSTLFHELAHQVVYVKDDTGFNESFATAVEEIGIERWLGARGDKGDMTRYRARKVLQQEIVALVDAARADLELLYASGLDQASMRTRKAARFERLGEDVTAALEAAGRDTDYWFTRGLNNARLVPVALYDGQVPAFRALHTACDFDLDCFYARVRELADLERDERDRELERLAQGRPR